MTTPLVAWYGDDFTGATDTLAVVARAGWRSMLFMGVPTPEQLAAAGPLDAIGIAGAARGMAPGPMAEELRTAGRFLVGTGARVLHYKCCSTFDSAPHVGNIAVAIQTLRDLLPPGLVPIVGGQPGIGRYCSFAQLFARAGGSPEIYRIDRHPVMSHHPVTPMHEADLRLHLQAQGLAGVGSLPHTAYPTGASASSSSCAATAAGAAAAGDVLRWLDQTLARHGGQPLLLDVTDEAQLPLLGRLMWLAARQAPLLAVGPSSVQQALALAWAADSGDRLGHADARGGLSPFVPPAPLGPAQGPVLVFAGSLSPVTARQVAHCRLFERQPLAVQRLLHEPGYAQASLERAARALAEGRHVLVHTDRPEAPVDSTGTAGTTAVAAATGQFVAALIRACAAAGRRLGRVGIAGGDTSSQATLALGISGLTFRNTLAPGVTVSLTHSSNSVTGNIEWMLKGGQMGGDELFDDWVEGRCRV